MLCGGRNVHRPRFSDLPLTATKVFLGIECLKVQRNRYTRFESIYDDGRNDDVPRIMTRMMIVC